jgi:hypothetical protein
MIFRWLKTKLLEWLRRFLTGRVDAVHNRIDEAIDKAEGKAQAEPTEPAQPKPQFQSPTDTKGGRPDLK